MHSNKLRRRNETVLSGKCKVVCLDDWREDTAICRDESCPIIEVHAAHAVLPSMRGRPQKSCPCCFKPIPKGQGPRCLVCGWDRRNSTITSALEKKRKCAK